MVWRRLSVPGMVSLAMLYDSIQIINGWDDTYLNQFRIFGKVMMFIKNSLEV
jgi:hypothetical protein